MLSQQKADIERQFNSGSTSCEEAECRRSLAEPKLIEVDQNPQECEISSSHGGEYDVQSCLLGYTAV
jgi:hypothetical protein